jgi:N-acyl-D-aspartate/D-glutamate deacylase
MTEADLRTFYRQPWVMVASDGGIANNHPRGAGTFPRVLGRYVRERKALSLARAIAKMSAIPAARARLLDRGRLAAGMAGDVVVFDADRVADTATFANPFQYPLGISAVVVNGVITVRNGTRPSVGAGQLLRPG